MKAVVYDKWLHTLGGGEVVACSMARILKDEGYDVLFISGKEVSPELIYEKLKINLKGVEFRQIWNDETAIRELVTGKDLFINISFLDYTIGFAKKNIYYVNFPTKLYDNPAGMLMTRVLLPLASMFIKPVEALNAIDAPTVIGRSPAYSLGEKNKYALSELKAGRVEYVTFVIYLEYFSKLLLENIKVSLENGKIIEKKVNVDHSKNTLTFSLKINPNSSTVYLNLNINNFEKLQKINDGKVYLFYPKMYLSKMKNFLFLDLFQKISVRLRAGIFTNARKRLETYQQVITYSHFAWKWIKRYWKTEATIIAPPVDLLYKNYKLENYKKKNWICSVGRFFTLGHGKKQEIQIEAFKKFYDKEGKGWELHLVGGLGDEPSSINFFKYLKELSKGYPIFFHINASKKEVDEVYLHSKIYWHSTGFGEDENYQPIRFEHFGISPIEAMSAKCIPILFNGGGLREIIKTTNLDESKNLFSSIDELVKNTANFKDAENKLDWKTIFEIMEKNYSQEAFKTNFLKLLNNE